MHSYRQRSRIDHCLLPRLDLLLQHEQVPELNLIPLSQRSRERLQHPRRRPTRCVSQQDSSWGSAFVAFCSAGALKLCLELTAELRYRWRAKPAWSLLAKGRKLTAVWLIIAGGVRILKHLLRDVCNSRSIWNGSVRKGLVSCSGSLWLQSDWCLSISQTLRGST